MSRIWRLSSALLSRASYPTVTIRPPYSCRLNAPLGRHQVHTDAAFTDLPIITSAHNIRRLLLRKDVEAGGVPDAKVRVRGWVRSVRAQKRVAFVHVNDGSTPENLQVVATPAMVEHVTNGSSIEVVGTVVKSIGEGQSLEIHASSIVVKGHSDHTFPLQKKFHTFDFLRELPHLRHRTAVIGAVMRIRNAAFFHLHRVLQDHDFLCVHAPVITSNDCEGGGETFQIAPVSAANPNFFGLANAMLTVSAQLHAETFVTGMNRVYSFGPTFRAENSNTPRHLAEFWMLEPEIAFATNKEAMDLAEFCIKSTLSHVLESCKLDLELLQSAEGGQGNLLDLLRDVSEPSRPFARISYAECMKCLLATKRDWINPPIDGLSLKFDHEQFIAAEVVNGPVFVTDYPAKTKPFYCRKNDSHVDLAYETSDCFDLLLPRVGELVGGSVREERLDVLERAMLETGGESLRESMWWYLDLRRYGCANSAGFGLGFDRLLLLLTGMSNVRDVVPVPRHPGWCRL